MRRSIEAVNTALQESNVLDSKNVRQAYNPEIIHSNLDMAIKLLVLAKAELMVKDGPTQAKK